MPPSQALERCEEAKQKLSDRIEELEKEVEECEEGMKKLKVVLYGKFGSASHRSYPHQSRHQADMYHPSIHREHQPRKGR